MERASDVAHLQLAQQQGRIVVTQDADLLRLHAAGISHAGIVYTSQRTPVGTFIRGLVLVFEALDPSEMQNEVQFL